MNLRGEFALVGVTTGSFSLFPACAGVIHGSPSSVLGNTAFPRMRGGDPRLVKKYATVSGFSPHARG